ncbi:MAG: hypothetical protein KDJ38_15165 [Gammaproteobacteria bacterium]|nr:hypothetical protein [Gammaproteobacteria bacterium]
MSDGTKKILMIAQHDKPEALRMASGLTLLDDEVSVLVIGQLGGDEETSLQMEALEFAEVPVTPLDQSRDEDLGRLADGIVQSDVVFVI